MIKERLFCNGLLPMSSYKDKTISIYHYLRTMQTMVLKFYIRISYEKLGDTDLFLFQQIYAFGFIHPFKISHCDIVNKIFQKVLKAGALIFGILIKLEKRMTGLIFD